MSLILNSNEAGVCGQTRSMLHFHRTAAIIGVGIAGAGLLLSGGEAINQAHEANAIKPKGDPVYSIPAEFYQNREIARQMAQLGIPQQAYNNQENNINQTQAAAIAAAQNSSNPSGAISNIVRQGNKAKATLDAEDAQARENNQRYFVQENANLGNQKLQQQQSDVFDKFTRDFNQYQADKGASLQNWNNVAMGAGQLGLEGIKYASNQPTDAAAAYGKQQFQNRAQAPTLDATGNYQLPGIPLPQLSIPS